MTCLIDDPLAPRVHAGIGEAEETAAAPAAEADEAEEADEVADSTPPAGPASMPSTRVPPPAIANSPADRRAREEAELLRRPRPPEPVSPLVSLVVPIGGYLQRHRDTTVPEHGGAGM